MYLENSGITKEDTSTSHIKAHSQPHTSVIPNPTHKSLVELLMSGSSIRGALTQDRTPTANVASQLQPETSFSPTLVP